MEWAAIGYSHDRRLSENVNAKFKFGHVIT
jgi:hypothetical protein